VTTSTHVAKGTLAGAVGTTSSNTGNTGNSTTSTPGFSTGLMAGSLADRIRLSTILGNLIVDEVDNIRPDGGLEDGGEADR